VVLAEAAEQEHQVERTAAQEQHLFGALRVVQPVRRRQVTQSPVVEEGVRQALEMVLLVEQGFPVEEPAQEVTQLQQQEERVVAEELLAAVEDLEQVSEEPVAQVSLEQR
jgi:hypothetical protein